MLISGRFNYKTMKNSIRIFGLAILLSILSKGSVYSQPDVYTTSGGEILFSFASIVQDGNETGSVLRFAPVFNTQTFLHVDFSRNIGLYTGLGIRNVGFIYDETDNIRKKFRTYNLGIPLALKLGNLRKGFIFGGYEFEVPFHYKEKTFINEQKSKFSVWFSDRVPSINHSVLVGIQFPYGLNLKFKYYLTEFFNRSFEAVDPDTGDLFRPYQDLEVNVMYISVAFNIFRNTEVYYFTTD